MKMINEKYAKTYCSEDLSKIENYEQAVNDKTQTWDCHHKLEIQGQFKNSPSLLKKCGLYYNAPAWQLIFLTKSEHMRIHNIGSKSRVGRHHSKETKKKISLSLSGKLCGEKNPMFGKHGYWFGKHASEETKKKLSDNKIGRKWFTNGVDEIFQYECPGQGWVRGRIKTSKKTK